MFISIKTELLILESGTMINNTDMDIRNGLMAHNTKETICKE